MLHEIPWDANHLHGCFDPSATPILRVESGDVISASVPDVAWGLEPPTSLTAQRRKVEPRDASGPCMLGPIAVRDALPGDALRVDLLAMRPSDWGWTYSGARMGDPALNARVGLGPDLSLTRWSVDHERQVVISDAGTIVPLRPFLGIIGVSPAEPGRHPGWTPVNGGAGGGNLDCGEIVVGTSLFLPVLTPGALLSIGDGHACQGDGEVAGTAVECLTDRVELRVSLLKNTPIRRPRIHTPHSWITLACAETLDEAARLATADMVDLLAERAQMSRNRALELASAAMHLRVTQMVNPLKGVHAVLPAAFVESPCSAGESD